MNDDDDARKEGRRAFLAKCGKFAAVTTPAVTLLMSASNQNFAVAVSGGHGGPHGKGPPGGGPGKSGGKGKGKGVDMMEIKR